MSASDYFLRGCELVVLCPCCGTEMYGQTRAGRLINLRASANADAVTLRKALRTAPNGSHREKAARAQLARRLEAAECRVRELMLE